MFDGLAPRYDLLNDVLSLGLDRWWRRAAVAALHVTPGGRVLDMGCGTGRLGMLLSGRHPVIGLDVSLAMLREARNRSAGRIVLIQGSAFRLPFRNASFGAAASAFVLRNLNDLSNAFGELARVVAPGGGLALLDITEPPRPLVRALFDAYFRTVAPAVGILVGKRGEYSYLVRSLTHLPPREEVSEMLRHAGFVGCVARPLTGGMVTLFTARRGVQGG
jgi:demethylmenaquinone methyltransferase / 2-methoxy-6-polyprenyl-1,4-benzoquinol methylase